MGNTKPMRAILLSLMATATLIAPQAYGQAGIESWSVDNTEAQSRIRQYQNYKDIYSEQSSGSTNIDTYEPSNGSATYKESLNAPIRTTHKDTERAQSVSPPSAIEELYSKRANQELKQFGYDIFGIPKQMNRPALDLLAANKTTPPSGAVQDEFILGSGDELEITFSGQRNDRELYKVNSQGMLLIKDFPPVPASGRSIGQVRISLESLAAQLHNTKIYISLSKVRQIGVLVIGHVKKPGKKTLTVFHTVIDALMESGGIDKSGSLRQIKLVRNGHTQSIDLYELLIESEKNIDLYLHEGDRIIIPPLGPTTAIGGEVKRPGIFELLPNRSNQKKSLDLSSEKLTLVQMLKLSGGALSPGQIRHLRLSINQNGQETLEEVQNKNKAQFADGSILLLLKGQEKRKAFIELKGHTLRPGLYALSENKTLRNLISSSDFLGDDIYPLIGVIERWNEQELSKKLIDFPLKNILSEEFDRTLKEGDVIHLFSNQQIAALSNILENNRSGNKTSLHTEESYANDENEIKDQILRTFLKERSAFVRGAVRKPGAYPISQGLTLAGLLSSAGGTALEANTANIELTSSHIGQGTQRRILNLKEDNPKTIQVGPGDSIRVNQKFKKIKDNSVTIIGEVQHPGRYDLLPGDKLSDLLKRAGGLTEQAYPYGAIFSRKSQRKAEEQRFKAQARAMEAAIAGAVEKENSKINAAKIEQARSLASELRNAEGIGRITVEADPAVLSARPQLDMYLESGDKLFIPKRHLTVRVSGEVLSPASLQFISEKESLDYIHEAGGFTYHADKERTFVLYPDGSAQPLKVSPWNYTPIKIPPGSTIMVPRDPKPFDFIQSAKDVSQVLSNLAVTAIFLDDLKDD